MSRTLPADDFDARVLEAALALQPNASALTIQAHLGVRGLNRIWKALDRLVADGKLSAKWVRNDRKYEAR